MRIYRYWSVRLEDKSTRLPEVLKRDIRELRYIPWFGIACTEITSLAHTPGWLSLSVYGVRLEKGYIKHFLNNAQIPF